MKTVIADKRWTRKYPHVGTGPMSSESCVSPEFFELERERVFRSCWLNVGRVDDVPSPGDFFVQDIAVCKTSIVVVRGRDRQLRAFHNLCSHRGNRLVWEERGNARVFVCGFHSWVYGTDGKLDTITDEENFFDLDKCALALSPVELDVWEGFIFVHLGTPTESLRDYLGDVAVQLGEGHFDKLERTFEYEVTEDANWKVALDAQNEIYHLPFQHRRTIPDFAVRKNGQYVRIQDFRIFKYHTVWATEVPEDRKVGPLEASAHRFGGPTPSGGTYSLPRIGDFDFYTIFPNMCLILTRGFPSDNYITYNFWPSSVDSTSWKIKMHFAPARNAGERVAQEYTKCLVRDVLYEDAAAHEAIHAGLASQVKPFVHYQDEEIQIRYFHEVLDRFCGVDGA